MQWLWEERRDRLARIAVSSSIIGLCALPASAINVLTVGDSTTYGTTDASSPFGYQVTLKQIIEANTALTVNYVGEYQDFQDFGTVPWSSSVTSSTWPVSSDYDYKHFGMPSGDIGEALDNLQNVAIPGATSADPHVLSGETLTQRLDTTSQAQPDLIIVHLGLNDISRNQDQTLPANQISAATITELGDDYEDLLIELGDQFPTANIMVALIMPKFGANTPFFSSNNTMGYNNTFEFNSEVKSRVDAIDGTGATAALDGRISTVDLFALSITDLVARGMGAGLASDAQDDADDFVDWGQGYDESSLRAGNSLGLNPDLYSDNVHPEDTGYQIEAWGLYDGLQDVGYIPEPGSLAILGGAMVALTLRRRRA